MWINHGNTSSRTFLARTRNDLLERQIALSVSLVEWTYCAHSVVLMFYLQMGPRLWGFVYFPNPRLAHTGTTLGNILFIFGKFIEVGKYDLVGYTRDATSRQLRDIGMEYRVQGSGTVFILNRLWLILLLDAMHCTTQHGIWTHNWISFGDWIQLYSRFSTHLLPVSTSHEFEPLTLSRSILATLLVLFACIIHYFTTLDFVNSACHESSKT